MDRTQPRDRNGLTEAEYLASYRPGDFRRPSVTTDVVLFAGGAADRRILLIRRGSHPFIGMPALPGGFVEENETVRGAAARELAEETGLSVPGLRLIDVFSEPGRDPRTWVISAAYLAQVPPGFETGAAAGDDAASADWFRVRTVPESGDIEIGDGPDAVRYSVPVSLPEGGFGVVWHSCARLAFDHGAMIARALKMCGALE